jgi:hypothetical protein
MGMKGPITEDEDFERSGIGDPKPRKAISKSLEPIALQQGGKCGCDRRR